MIELRRTGAGGTEEDWPRPLPVVLAPAQDEALSSWITRHAAFYGLSRAAMHRHCAPDAYSLQALDREFTPGQETRLAHLFRRDRPILRGMTHEDLGSDVIGRLVARRVDHRCERCARSLAEQGCPEAVPRAWFHTWRITCARCGSRVLQPTPATCVGGEAPFDFFPHLWAEALKGEHLLDGFVHRTAAVRSVLPTTLLRLLMISTGNESTSGNGERSGKALDVVVPGFDAAIKRHGIAIPPTSLIDVPLPARIGLLAGLALAAEEPEGAIRAMWAATSGMHRAHFGFVVTEMLQSTGSFSGLTHWQHPCGFLRRGRGDVKTAALAARIARNTWAARGLRVRRRGSCLHRCLVMENTGKHPRLGPFWPPVTGRINLRPSRIKHEAGSVYVS